ncbi:carboxypeptidase-like regulatory domain-containing protein [Galbitalea sp. SE-J8]|uniref:carboxypeptidase-like regulatory domain-containing protein n=1 Tax=Galbitalea sp. SE-J8 TaxID=3054952 RepID=UPI00259CF033|nr:carboxypeptidase-like regulatory domain-containing protein [Galbitalea sp. SE-J8]MDM4762626.1 carboxypeptidase-like regulatory domain-containing protein [Galbitalea sp. SE-J8]
MFGNGRAATAVVVFATGAALVIGPGALAANASAPSAAITGKVVASLIGQKGATARAGISVKAESTSGRVYTTRTNSAGEFFLSGTAAGTYSIRFGDTVGHRQCDGGCGSTKYFHAEWLGDATSFAAAERIVLASGEKHTGVREVIGERSRITGTVTKNGKAVKGTDVRISAESISSDKKYALVPGPRFYFDVLKGNYRIKVYSASHAFASFYVTDPEDGNQVFHANGVDKRTGLKVDVVAP